MDKSARVEAHKYTGMTRAELHSVAVERVQHYSKPHPAGAGGTCALLRSAWEWVEQRFRGAGHDE